MQDRFRFRAWYTDYDKNTEMIYDVQGTYDTGCCEDYPGSSHHDRFQDVLMDSNAIVMQCTGLKDKNGKLIYEGDIVKFLGVPCKIVFELGEFCIVRNCKFITVNEWYELLYADNWNDDTYSLAQLYFNTEGEENFIDKVEVIGNIYENTELLEVE